jgi:diaminopimelate epimerase
MVQISLTKHHGAGNDFLVLLDLNDAVGLRQDEVRQLCDRHRGIGADGLITVTGPSGGGDVTMRLVNQDGSPAEISGNGLRCVVHEVVRSGVVAPGSFAVMTGAGLRTVHCHEPHGASAMTSASMGIVSLNDTDLDAGRVVADVGNPHLVVVVNDLDAIDVQAAGHALQGFQPGGINVEWVQVLAPDHLALKVFERGVGPTLACGSGSVAVAAALRALGLSGSTVVVDNPGGSLGVSFDGDEAILSGEVTVIAELLVTLERGE